MAKYVAVIGFATANVNESKPESVYLGTDPAAADACITASPLKTFYTHQDGGVARRFTKPDAPKAAAKKAAKKDVDAS